MQKLMLILAASLGLAGTTLAQAPAAATPPALTQEQAQQLMLRQMQMMAAMFDSRRSRLGFDETVAALADNAGRRGWAKVEVHDVQSVMKKAGATNTKRMKALATCPPTANERLAKASGGKLPPLPCRYTVYEGQDGKIFVMRMNTPLLAKTVQGDATQVMLDIAAEEEALFKGIVE